MKEIWKPIKGLETHYEVSNLGRVRSLTRYVDYSDGRRMKRKGLIKKQLPNHKGYLMVSLFSNNHKSVHRLVAENFIPNLDNKPQVNHIDGNKLNNSVDNLEWVTNSENQKHAFRLGFQNNKGENHPSNKLNDLDVLTIRMVKNLYSVNEISKIFNVSCTNIRDILKRKTWMHI